MQLLWGTYPFAVNGVDVTSRVRLVRAESGRPLRYVVRNSVSGWLEADGQKPLADAEAALRAALRTPYLDLVLKTDAGDRTPVSLISRDSLSGAVVVDGPAFTGTDGAEYATLRQFAFEVEAEYVIRDAANAVVSFTESITISGTGGPVRRVRVPINSPTLIRQQVSPASVVRTTQSGSAVGHTRYPAPPAPLWPAYLLADQVVREQGSPKRVGQGFVEYPVRWAYTFESAKPLAGAPSLPPL